MRGPSPSARARGATRLLPPPTPTSAACLAWRSRAGARCLWGIGAAIKLAACAHHSALVVIGLWRTESHWLGERPLSFGARPWCDVPAAASNANQRRVSRAAQARWRSLSLGNRRSTKSCCLRASSRAGCGQHMAYGRALLRREASLFWRAPVVRRASCRLQRQPASVLVGRSAWAKTD